MSFVKVENYLLNTNEIVVVKQVDYDQFREVYTFYIRFRNETDMNLTTSLSLDQLSNQLNN